MTRNLKDFPRSALALHGIEAQHPDTFIHYLLQWNLGGVIAAAHQQRANLKNPPRTIDEYLIGLERQGLTQTVAVLREFAAVL